jgi:cysteine desulfurase
VRAYLDHATASPLRPEVVSAIGELLGVAQADPGRAYEEALVTRDLVEDARRSVARLAGTTARQVVFTSAITESVTTAVAGLVQGGRILAASTERSSVLDAARRHGTVVEIPVDAHGHIDVDGLRSLLEEPADLVCCAVANHETGVLTDVAQVIEIARSAGAAVHVDAATGFGHVPIDLGALDADAVTVTGEMIGSPIGSSALLVRKGRPFPALLEGGAQERGRRGGLENLIGIVGFGVAAEVVQGALLAEAVEAARQVASIEAAAIAVEGVGGVGDPDPDRRAGFLRCFTVQGVEAEPVLIGLDRAGVSIHSGSACASESLEPSPVLAAMGLDAERSFRVSVGWSTTDADIERFCQAIGPVVDGLRALRS